MGLTESFLGSTELHNACVGIKIFVFEITFTYLFWLFLVKTMCNLYYKFHLPLLSIFSCWNRNARTGHFFLLHPKLLEQCLTFTKLCNEWIEG
jgi:hypothetical protein